jgi:hypothetical protein
MLLGLLMIFAIGIWPAHADVSAVSVTAPTQTIAGFYDEDGTAKAFSVTPSGTARTTCGYGWASIDFRITGPGDYDETFAVSNEPGGAGTWTGSASSAWNTRGLLNGEYTVRLNVKEQQKTNTLLDNRDDNCPGQQSSASRKVNVAGAPETPAWDGSPAPATGGAAPVTLKWKKNPEADIIAYEITRSGPGPVLPPEPVPPSVCNASTCQVQDSSYTGDYGGTYTYKIVAVRSAPAGTGEACGSERCVKSKSSDTKSVTLTTPPTPSPSPSQSQSPSNSPTATPGGGSNRGSTSNTNRGTRVLSFGGGGGSNQFYEGTFDQNLPYQPKTLVLGGGQTTAPNGRQTEAAAFRDEPPNYRTIMLPVAGGLLAFLSAAHVRRLLLHF